MKRIKCEWCGHYYDLNKYETCPKCGGSNSNINIETDKPSGIFYERPNSFNKENGFSTTKVTINKNGKKQTFVYSNFNNKKLLKIIIVPLVIFVAIILFSILGFIFEEVSYYTDKDNLVYFYLDNSIIETDEGRIYFDSFYINKDYVYDNEVDIDFNVFVEKNDYKNHIIDFYLYQGDNKYRLSTNYFNSSSENVGSLNEIFKANGKLSFDGSVDVTFDDNDNLFDFDRLLVEIDDNTYTFNLTMDEIEFSWNSDSVEYYVSEKICFGENNIFYIDKFTLNEYSRYSSVSINFSNVIEDYSFETLEIYVKDSDGLLHRLFFEYGSNLNSIEDLLKTNLNNSRVSFEIFANGRVYEGLIFVIDGVSYDIPLTLVA